MTNTIVLSHARIVQYTQPSIEQRIEIQQKPHALYDGAVFVVWALGFYIITKASCLFLKTVFTKY